MTTHYSYDGASRLTELIYKRGSAALGNLTYEYDKAGRRVKMTGSFARTLLPQALSVARYDDANQQTSALKGVEPGNYRKNQSARNTKGLQQKPAA